MKKRLSFVLLVLGATGCADSGDPDTQVIDVIEVPDLGGGSDVEPDAALTDVQLDTGRDVGQDVAPDVDAGPTDTGTDTDVDVCVPATEVCDGLDNDCDDLTDEADDGTALTQTCYDGPEGTEGVGICTPGTQTCFEGAYGACQAAVLPRDETCDSLDNDCNGVADDISEGTCDCEPSSVRDCYDGPEGTAGVAACAAGTQTCRADGTTWEPCVGQTLPATEVCDAQDNDCDGTTDNVENEGTACMAGTGACESSGLYVCDVDRAELVCDAVAGEPGVEVCDLVDNDCDTVIDNVVGLGDPCTVGVGACQADGIRVCDADAGQLTCNGTELASAEESCDGVDNDCDSLVDEAADGSPLTTTCYSGPESTVGVGLCRAGTATCADGSFGPCVGETLPVAEICDTLDNNCDGTPDNRAVGTCECEPSSTRICYGGPTGTSGVGVCTSGTQTCAADGGAWGPCEGQTLPSSDICDGLDNDCDGSEDEGNPGGGATCDTGRDGVCAAGTTVCEDGAIACTQNVASSAEVCDGVDNDCDGSLDEGNPGGGATCSTGRQGVCAAGTTVCEDGAIACTQNVASSAEVCDGVDNDCDGSLDEGNPGGGATCSTGRQGVCAAGTTVCQSGAIACTQNVASSAEVCDSVDNDCDGSLNEGNPGGGATCSTGRQGVCAAGTTVCQSGAIACNQNVASSAEVCDGVDNDCDGSIDEGNPGGGATCSTGRQGVCAAGTTVCQSGAIACNQNVASSAEVCDGVDNDCDGSIDEGNPGGGATCSTGRQGVCAAGTTVCQSGAIACNQNVASSAEVCDGVDNDCDGSLDEGNPGGGVTCNTGRSGVCAAGTTVCQSGALTCSQNVASSAEICDGADNDCDGAQDEGNPGGGGACNTGRSGVCAAGTTVCQSGALACAQNVALSAEVCDGLDNDCDSSVDEGNPGGGTTCNTGGPGVCAAGTTVCQSGGLSCNQNVSSSAEVCDGLDNDCDGVADDITVGWTALNYPAALGCVDLAVGDINGDSRPDVVCAPQITSAVNPDTRLHYYVQNASGTFQSVRYTPAVPEGPFRAPSQIALADVDRDGDLDLVTSGETQRIWILRNSSGTFGTPQLAFDFSASAEPGTGGLIVRDFNGDTFLDIVAMVGTLRDGSGWRLALSLGVGNGTFQTPILSTSTGARTSDLQAGDFDRDGDLDVIGIDGTRVVRWNYNAGSFGTPSTVVSVSTFTPHLTYADVNGDTFGDILVPGSDLFTIVPGTSTGFGTATTTAVVATVQALRLGGFDCDGAPELAVLIANSGQPVSIFTDAATRTTHISAFTNNGGAMHVGDMNGDGLDDIVVGQYTTGGGITVHRQTR